MQLLQQVKFEQSSTSPLDGSLNTNCAGIQFSKTYTRSVTHIDEYSWILDSGETEHMSYNESMFINLKLLPFPLMVNLPNSYRVRVTHVGSVILLPNLVLSRVLFIPSFKFNLLSVFQLCQQFKCILAFTPSVCLLQGRSVNSPLEVGESHKGLYIFQSRPLSCSFQPPVL